MNASSSPTHRKNDSLTLPDIQLTKVPKTLQETPQCYSLPQLVISYFVSLQHLIPGSPIILL